MSLVKYDIAVLPLQLQSKFIPSSLQSEQEKLELRDVVAQKDLRIETLEAQVS